MNLISLEKAAKAYAHRSLLDGVSLGVSAGDRIGVVGRNGAGKSTLLALLAGRVQPDTGRVAMTTGLRLGYLPQNDPLAGTVGEIVFGSASGAVPTPWEADPRARTIMAELLPGISVDAAAPLVPVCRMTSPDVAVPVLRLPWMVQFVPAILLKPATAELVRKVCAA